MEKWVALGRYSDEELLVIRSVLDSADIAYLVNLQDNSEVLRLYTAGAGYMGTELLVKAEDYEQAMEILGV